MDSFDEEGCLCWLLCVVEFDVKTQWQVNLFFAEHWGDMFQNDWIRGFEESSDNKENPSLKINTQRRYSNNC